MGEFVLNLSLREILIRKIVIHLWNADDTFDSFLLKRFQPPFYQHKDEWLADSQNWIKDSEEWREVLEKVKMKVTELGRPPSLEKKMMLVVKPIGLEMFRGKLSLIAENLSDSRRDVDMLILKQLCWTHTGELNYSKTAENLVCLETLDVVKRFKLACLNFLVDRIPGLWRALPAKYQKCYEDDWDPLRQSVTSDEYYWYGIVNDKQSEMNPDVHQKAFAYSAKQANKAGTEYFFQKLSKVERDSSLCSTVREIVVERFINGSSLLKFFPKQSFSAVLFYLLSEMSQEEQKQVFQEHACYVLGCFLDWPLQDLLPDIADVVWPYIPESKYQLLQNIMNKNFSSSGYYFPDVFQKFFLGSPAAFRKFFLKHDNTFLPEFINTKDVDTIEVILGRLDVVDRVELISSKVFFYEICNKLLMDGSCDFVKLFLRVGLESVEDRERVRNTFMGYAKWLGEGKVECRLQNWKEVFESLEEHDANAVNKRSLEADFEGGDSEVKKPCAEAERLPRN